MALALQASLRRELCSSRSESPLRLAWRQAGSEPGRLELWSLRRSLGVMMLFAALRPPLAVQEELPMRYCALLGEEAAHERNMLPVLKGQPPDAIFVMGCIHSARSDSTTAHFSGISSAAAMGRGSCDLCASWHAEHLKPFTNLITSGRAPLA